MDLITNQTSKATSISDRNQSLERLKDNGVWDKRVPLSHAVNSGKACPAIWSDEVKGGQGWDSNATFFSMFFEWNSMMGLVILLLDGLLCFEVCREESSSVKNLEFGTITVVVRLNLWWIHGWIFSKSIADKIDLWGFSYSCSSGLLNWGEGVVPILFFYIGSVLISTLLFSFLSS